MSWRWSKLHTPSVHIVFLHLGGSSSSISHHITNEFHLGGAQFLILWMSGPANAIFFNALHCNLSILYETVVHDIAWDRFLRSPFWDLRFTKQKKLRTPCRWFWDLFLCAYKLQARCFQYGITPEKERNKKSSILLAPCVVLNDPRFLIWDPTD